MKNTKERDRRWVRAWLLAGVIMVLVQIVLGGITRLTGSGLSITRWDIVTGVLPPVNEAQWEDAFSLYQATPQYQKINEGMRLEEFKFIFFWEYIHRLWARMMGFVFLFPFLFFLWRRSLSGKTLMRLGVVVFIAALAAVFGWIMVASGLVQRPWVNAYKLTIHLGLGISLFVFLFYTWISERGYRVLEVDRSWVMAIRGLIVLTVIQVCFGGFVSGMRSALLYPTWPDMHGSYIPSIVMDPTHWTVDALLLYDQSGFMPALVQVVHRNLGYVLVVCVLFFAYRWWKTQRGKYSWLSYALAAGFGVQVCLGIITLLYSKGSIPVWYGAAHQAVGIVVLTLLIYIHLILKPVKY